MSRHAAESGLSMSMHERLMNQCNEEFVMLDQQYRMNSEISKFPCCQFYSGKITNGDNVTCTNYKSDIALSTMGPYSFINVRGWESQMHSGSYVNEAECVAVVNVVEKISASAGINNWHCPEKLRIITFYQGQVALLRRYLSKRGYGKVLVASVDSSQGTEADVVVISFVRSNSKKSVRGATGFLADDRRVNVALTRARHQLICIGNSDTLRNGSETLKCLVHDAKERRTIT